MHLRDLFKEEIKSSRLINEKDRLILLDFVAVWLQPVSAVIKPIKPITIQRFIGYINGIVPDRLRGIMLHQQAMLVMSKIFKDQGHKELSDKFLSFSAPCSKNRQKTILKK